VLPELFEGSGVMSSALADRMEMIRVAISKLADRLVAKRLIERLDNEKDERTHILRLTESSCKLVPTLPAVANNNDAEFFGHLSNAERHSMESIMKAVIEKVSEPLL